MVRRRRDPQSRSVNRRRPHLEGGRNPGPRQLKAHTRFGFAWDWNGEETVLQSRCTDERGETQPTPAELAKFWRVEPEFFRTTGTIPGHFNAIQPWKVNRDGSVQNALVL